MVGEARAREGVAPRKRPAEVESSMNAVGWWAVSLLNFRRSLLSDHRFDLIAFDLPDLQADSEQEFVGQTFNGASTEREFGGARFTAARLPKLQAPSEDESSTMKSLVTTIISLTALAAAVIATGGMSAQAAQDKIVEKPWGKTAGGEAVKDRPVSVNDLLRTACHSLSIDADKQNMSSIGRPIKIVDGGEVAVGRRGEARLDDVDAQPLELARDARLFFPRHRCARALLAVAQRRVENDQVIGHGDSPWLV